jgi:hypothetical protein
MDMRPSASLVFVVITSVMEFPFRYYFMTSLHTKNLTGSNKGQSRHQTGDQTDAQLQIVPRRPLRARRRRAHAHDPQGSSQSAEPMRCRSPTNFTRWRARSVRNDLDNALQGKFRRLINNATQSLPIRRLACLLV